MDLHAKKNMKENAESLWAVIPTGTLRFKIIKITPRCRRSRHYQKPTLVKLINNSSNSSTTRSRITDNQVELLKAMAWSVTAKRGREAFDSCSPISSKSTEDHQLHRNKSDAQTGHLSTSTSNHQEDSHGDKDEDLLRRFDGLKIGANCQSSKKRRIADNKDTVEEAIIAMSRTGLDDKKSENLNMVPSCVGCARSDADIVPKEESMISLFGNLNIHNHVT